MTGFARSHGASGPYAFEWELKSVNAKGFDLRLRLPPGWDELEALAKKRAGELLSRGTVYANLTVKRTNAVSTVRINEDVLASIVKVAGTLAVEDRCRGAEHRRPAQHQGRDRSRRARNRRGRGQGGEGGRSGGVRSGADPSGRDAPARRRGAGANPQSAHGRDRAAGQEGGSRARPQARGDQGTARRADRDACWKPPIVSIPTGSIRKRC